MLLSNRTHSAAQMPALLFELLCLPALRIGMPLTYWSPNLGSSSSQHLSLIC